MIKVLIADDLRPICKRYENYINKNCEMQAIEIAHSGKEAVEKAISLTPDVILMDIEMETRTAGLDAARQILKQLPQTKIIILTVYEDDEFVFQAFQLGVSDYLLKDASPEEIVSCIQDAYHNCSPIRPVIAEKIRREFQRVKTSEQSFLYCLHIITQMTQTEIDILDLSSQGYSRSQICEIRCVELSTIKTHIKSILKKFNKTSLAEVIALMNELQIFDYIRNISKNMPLNKGEK
ncbi:response regulator transcription factor [Enterocloster clostridioformis]|uniref:response regulator transcription factor n=1 Tax=Enterocloster clostridioformis TaxID=1531 RepID=UPI002676C6F1|nr:response regulator transcription factor [Enterocloster clostridioformis]